MSSRCKECGSSTQYEAELGSAVCVQCGTLVDASQNILSSHLEGADSSAREFPYLKTGHSSTLKGRKGWALAGQGKEARNRKNTVRCLSWIIDILTYDLSQIATHQFIRTILVRLSNPGAAARAQSIFDQAMLRAQYRWGRKTQLAAGAAIAIALRESHKSDSINDIAVSHLFRF